MTKETVANRYYLPEGWSTAWSTADEKKLRLRSVCAECGERVYAWREQTGQPSRYLACHRHNINKHEGIARLFTQPGEKEILARREDMSDENVRQHQALTLKGVPLSGLLTEEQARFILKTIWKDAPEVEVLKAAILCRDYGLHPLMKHVYLIPYKGQTGTTWTTVLGIGAKRLIASRRGTFSYIDDTPRVMSEEEQRRIYGRVDSTNIVAITKLRTKEGLEAAGYGKYPKEGKPMGTDKGNSVENMAFIRSEGNAFGRLFPDAQMPTNVEVVDEQYMETLPEPPEIVDTETGEITHPAASSAPPATTTATPVKPDSPASAYPTPPQFNAFWTTILTRGWTASEMELLLGCTVPTWLRKPENKGKGLADILAMLPDKNAEKAG